MFFSAMVTFKVLEKGADFRGIVIAAVAGGEPRRNFGALVGSRLWSTVFYVGARRTGALATASRLLV